MQKQLKLMNERTGEVLDLSKASDLKISQFLTDVSFQRLQLEKLEAKIKTYIRTERLEDDEDVFGNHKVIRTTRIYFDKDRFLKEATKSEIDLYHKWIDIEAKYQKGTVSISFK